MHRKVAAALVAALALLAAGCGGGEGGLTRAELVRRVEVACRQGQQRLQSQSRAFRGSQAAYIAAVLAEQRFVIARIKDLHPPGAAKADYEALKQGMQQRMVLVARVHAAGAANLERELRAVKSQAEAATQKVEVAVRNLGIQGCA